MGVRVGVEVGVEVGVGVGVTEVLQLLGLQPWLGVHSGQFILASNSKSNSNSNSNSNKQQQQQVGLNSISRVRRSPKAPNLGRRVPYPRRSYPPSLGPQLPGGAGRQSHDCQKWPRLRVCSLVQQQATAGGPKFNISGTPIAQGPKLRAKGPLPKALIPTKFGNI